MTSRKRAPARPSREEIREGDPTVLLKDDSNLVTRIEDFGHNLSDAEANMMESFVRRVRDEKRPLSFKQRVIAEAIDERRVR